MDVKSISISIQDAHTLCRGAMSSMDLTAAQATQAVARVQMAIQAAAKAAAESKKGEGTDNA